MILTHWKYWRFLLPFMVVRTVFCVLDYPNDISTFGENDDYRSDGDYDLVNNDNDDGEDSSNEDVENHSLLVSSDDIDSYCQKNELSVNFMVECYWLESEYIYFSAEFCAEPTKK